MQTPIIAGALFTLFALWFLRHALKALQVARSSLHWSNVSGKIKKLDRVCYDATRNNRSLFVEYTYQVGNNEYSAKKIALYSLQGHEVEALEAQLRASQTVPVFYDPDSPQLAVLIPGLRKEKPYSDIAMALVGVCCQPGRADARADSPR